MLVARYQAETNERGEVKMKEVANNIMQFIAIIMILITLAVSTAALGQMFG